MCLFFFCFCVFVIVRVKMLYRYISSLGNLRTIMFVLYAAENARMLYFNTVGLGKAVTPKAGLHFRLSTGFAAQ
uniref:Uncharacterized protein n=1 Tax=Anguilla anguilla TaxID=7936 RepID=A0A0E9SDL4_ANGAN